MKLVRLSAFLFLYCIATSFYTDSSPTIAYVDQFKELAIVEMQRSGIPASITLAQGILESSNGRSPLAIQANNHFGIKCKKYWRGLTYFHKDDDLDENGNLIKSCFRSYETVIDSYVDHTNFLKQTAHYQELFSYHTTDYTNWAIGLKRCGYATDPGYSNKLISIIERNELYRYDH